MDSNRGDVAELRHGMQLGFARMDARFEQVVAMMDARFQQVEERGATRLEKALRDQTRFFFLAWSVQIAAFVGLYAR